MGFVWNSNKLRRMGDHVARADDDQDDLAVQWTAAGGDDGISERNRIGLQQSQKLYLQKIFRHKKSGQADTRIWHYGRSAKKRA